MDLFQSCGHCWVFQICWNIECSTFTASSFSIWNSSTGIPSHPLALFVMMLSKAHMTSHSRMSGSRWVITPLAPLTMADLLYKSQQSSQAINCSREQTNQIRLLWWESSRGQCLRSGPPYHRWSPPSKREVKLACPINLTISSQLGAGGGGDDRVWDGWMASPTR